MLTHRRLAARAALLAAAAAVAILLAAAFARPFHSSAQTTASKDAKSPGSITGRVVTSEGRPAAGLALALMPADFVPDRRAVARGETDSDGRFRLANVPAGRYRLQLLAPTHAAPEVSGNSPFSAGRLITVGAGEAIEDINLTVARGGVITGRITSADGRPIIGAQVRVIRPDKRGPEAAAVNPFEFDTDDRGVYRVYGLPAGRYLVAVGEDRDSGMVTVGAAGGRYARTYHPAATDAAQARQIEVTAGGEATGVDITLAEGPKSFQATGRIVDAETNQPVADVGFGHTAIVGDGREFGGFAADGSKTNQNGEFTIRNLVPGRYAAFVFQFGGPPSNSYGDPVRFEVADGDVSGLVIKLRRGGSVSGSAVVEGTSDRGVLAKLSTLTVYPNVTPIGGKTDELSMPSFGENKINPDGTFRVTGLRPGRLTFNVWAFPQPKGFTLLRVERGGVEVPREGIEIGAGEQISGIRLVIGYGTGVVRGQVSVTGGALPEGARLNVSAQRVGAATGGFGGAEIDSRGRFSLEGLMPGEYELTVRASVRGAPGAPPPRFPSVKQTVSVLDSGEVSVSFVYDLSKPVEPNH